MTPRCKQPQGAQPVSRRTALAGVAALAGGLAAAPLAAATRKTPPQPKDDRYEVVEVGPGKRFASLTEAGVFMNSGSGWNNSYADPEQIARRRFRVIISPGPPGYYVNDSGSHSRRWKQPIGWPPYEGILYGPVIIEGEAGKPAPLLCTDGRGEGVLYYQKGLFITGNFDATFRRLAFRGFRRSDGYGNYAAIRLDDAPLKAPMIGKVLIEDCSFSGCDNGLIGGMPGQSITLRRCHFHHNGNGTGAVHNLYIGMADQLVVEELLSTDCTIGHLLKSRAARTVIRNSRLLGGSGSESYCLDLPDGGVLEIDGLVCEKSPDADNGTLIHYSGENQDAHGAPFHAASSIRIRNLTMLGPERLRRRPARILGFRNDSGAGEATSGKGSHLVSPDAQNVQVFRIGARAAGLPCRELASLPPVDRRPPIIA